MNDVTALMGKLKANVAYLQFDEPTEQRAPALDLSRAVQAQAEPLEDKPAPPVAAPAAPARSSLLSRYVAPAAEPAPAQDTAKASRVLADIFARLQRA